jgi:hypothetical protein
MGARESKNNSINTNPTTLDTKIISSIPTREIGYKIPDWQNFSNFTSK